MAEAFSAAGLRQEIKYYREHGMRADCKPAVVLDAKRAEATAAKMEAMEANLIDAESNVAWQKHKVADLQAKLQQIRSFGLLDGDEESCILGVIDCPKGEPLHYHHDGCPVCWKPEGEK